MCCKWLPIAELDKPAGVLCPFCNQGCIVHGTPKMPDECSRFECMYYQMEKCSEELRPDRSGVIFEKLSEKLIFGTAIKAPLKQSAIINKQVAGFLLQGYSVVLDHFNEKRLSVSAASDRKPESVMREFRQWQAQHTQPI